MVCSSLLYMFSVSRKKGMVLVACAVLAIFWMLDGAELEDL